MVLHVRARMEHVRHGRRVPSLSSSVDGNAVPILPPLVAAPALVSGKLICKLEPDPIARFQESSCQSNISARYEMPNQHRYLRDFTS